LRGPDQLIEPEAAVLIGPIRDRHNGLAQVSCVAQSV
jgi:hypothetical protein